MWPLKKKEEKVTVELLTVKEMREKWAEAVCPLCGRRAIKVGDWELPERVAGWDEGKIRTGVYAAQCGHCGFGFNVAPAIGRFEDPDEEPADLAAEAPE